MHYILIILLALSSFGCDNGSIPPPKTSKPAIPTTPQPETSQRPATTTPEVIELTAKAAEMFHALSKQSGFDHKAYLRVSVKHEGTTGFSYALDITESVDPTNDLFGESLGVRIVVDQASEPYLTGTKIDFRTTDEGSGFLFDNPNAIKIEQ